MDFLIRIIASLTALSLLSIAFMQRCPYALLLFAVLLCAPLILAPPASAQVTFVSPEEARKILKDSQTPDQKAKPPDSRRVSLLPDQFAAWKATSLRKFGEYNAATLAGEDAPVLLEYQYQRAEQRQYTDGSRALTVDAFRLKDSSGSYGLFTYYRSEDWQTSDVTGAQVASRGEQTLLRKEEVLARVSGGRLSPSELAALAAGLGVVGGGPLPTLPHYLPERDLVVRSTRFVVGPQALARRMPGVPTQLIDFGLDPEAEIAEYRVPGQPPAKLLLVSYPTPQIAALKMKSLESEGGMTGGIFARREGPLLAFAFAGSKEQADRLLNQVHYSALIVWNEPVDKNEVPKFREFLINVLLLIVAWLVFAIAAGLLFGLTRVLVKKWYPSQVFDRPEETEVIRLNISH